MAPAERGDWAVQVDLYTPKGRGLAPQAFCRLVPNQLSDEVSVTMTIPIESYEEIVKLEEFSKKERLIRRVASLITSLAEQS